MRKSSWALPLAVCLAVGAWTPLAPAAVPSAQSASFAGVAELLSLSESSRISDVLKIARSLGSLDVVDLAPPAYKSLAPALLETYAQLGISLSRSERTLVLSEVARLPLHVQLAAGALLSTINYCDAQVRHAWRQVSNEDHAWFVEASMEGKQLAPAEEARMNEIAERVDMARIIACAILVADTIDEQIPSLKTSMQLIENGDPADPPQIARERFNTIVSRPAEILDDLIAQGCWDNGPGTPPWGEILPEKLVRIGHEGNNCYSPGGTILTIDLGGADRYANGAGVGTAPLAVSISIDIGPGNDHYTSGQAVGISGIGFLFDERGDDSYAAGFNQVRAGGGVAVLADESGTDTYTCTTNCQGFSDARGVSILLDFSGADALQAAGTSQGSVRGGGVALLLDLDGDDNYRTGTESQGYTGAGGGTAVLLNRDGHDQYNITNAFGRGNAWPPGSTQHGIAVFIDIGGPDTYIAGPGQPNNFWGPGQSMTIGANPRAVYARGHDCADANVCMVQFQAALPGT